MKVTIDLHFPTVHGQRAVMQPDIAQKAKTETWPPTRIEIAPNGAGGRFEFRLVLRVRVAVANTQAYCIIHVAHSDLPDEKMPPGGGLNRAGLVGKALQGHP